MRGGFIVFSACQGRDAHLDVADTVALDRHLAQEGIPTLKVLGKYAGKSETSFVVDEKYLNTALKLAHECNQKCVLLVEDNHDAYLIPTGAVRTKQYIGAWTEVDDPKGHDHTTNQYSNQHFIIV